MDSWVSAGDGLSRCLAHPGVPAFAAHLGCADCHGSTASTAADEPVETDAELEHARAVALGLPDALSYELRLFHDYERASAQADLWIERADSHDGDMELLVKIGGLAAKWADTAAKTSRPLQQTINAREERAAVDRRNRTGLLGSQAGKH